MNIFIDQEAVGLLKLVNQRQVGTRFLRYYIPNSSRDRLVVISADRDIIPGDTWEADIDKVTAEPGFCHSGHKHSEITQVLLHTTIQPKDVEGQLVPLSKALASIGSKTSMS